MKTIKHALIMAFTLVCALILCGAALGESVSAPDVVPDETGNELAGYVILLHTGDWHGAGNENLGLARVSYAKSQLEAAGAEVILLDSGNSLFDEQDADAAGTGAKVVSVMNEVGYSAMIPGPAELSDGGSVLSALSMLSRFTILNGARSTATFETSGMRVGVFGLTASPDAEGSSLDALIDTARGSVAALQAENCDIIVALCHLGQDADGASVAEALAAQVEGIQIVIDGGRGETLAEGKWLGEGTLLSACAGDLTAIGCVAINPSGQCAGMVMDADWFDDTMTDPRVAEMQAELP